MNDYKDFMAEVRKESIFNDITLLLYPVYTETGGKVTD